MSSLAFSGGLSLLLLAAAVACLPTAAGTRVIPKTPRDGPSALLRGISERLTTRQGPDPLDVASDVELFAACLRAGLSTQQAAGALARVGQLSERWGEVAALLAVGARGQRAWGRLGIDELARLVVMSGQSGAAIARGCERISHTLRVDAQAQATAAAERAGVFVALPLAVCFLPAFVVLGLVPVVISLGAQLL
ncbi:MULTISPECIES: type II secretion system F family protein [unclassified Corynebacterium]|uniref:type II secretion system F family protein n=1 Tax=unclassified Corynebacterium TaxID=2624378 RepID=UPI0034CE5A18